jgi:hypothetical protein
MRTFKLYCLSATLVAALLTAISMFIANVGHTEYKSQMRKRKVKKIEETPFIDNTQAFTQKELMEDDLSSEAMSEAKA